MDFHSRTLKLYSSLLSRTILSPMMDYNMFLEAVDDYGNYSYITDITRLLIVCILQFKSSYIRFIVDPSEELQFMAIQKSLYNIEFILNPTEAVQLKVVTEKGSLIRFIQNPTLNVQLAFYIY